MQSVEPSQNRPAARGNSCGGRRRRLLCSLLVVFVLAVCTTAAPAAEMPHLRLETGGHTARVMQVAFTPDGSTLVSAGFDKVVRVWDARTGAQRRVLRGPLGNRFQGSLNALAVASDGSVYAGGYAVSQGEAATGESFREVQRNSFRRFDLTTGETRRVYSAEKMDTVIALVVSPRGDRVASGGGDSRVALWEAETGKVRMLTGHQGDIYDLAFSPDGSRVASGSLDGTVCVWDAVTGKQEWKTDLKGPVLSLTWGATGIIAAATYEDSQIHLLAGQSGALIADLKQPDAAPCLAFSADGKILLSGSGASRPDFAVRVWDAEKKTVLRTFDRHKSTVLALAVSPDGRIAASADGAGVIYLWNIESGEIISRLAGSGSIVESVAWVDDPKRRVVCWGGGATTDPITLPHRFDLDNNLPLPALPAGTRFTAPAPGRRLVLHQTPINDRRARPFVTVEGGAGPIITINDDDWEARERLHTALLLPEGDVVVGSDFGLRRYAIDGAKGRRTIVYSGHSAAVRALAVSPDGQYLASGSDDQTVRVWNLRHKGRQVPALLSLYRGSNDVWVAWNDEYGYYAASPGGDEVVGWHVNRADTQSAVYYAAARYAGRFYRPDVVCRLLEAGDVPEALQRVGRLVAQQLKTPVRPEEENTAILPPLAPLPPVTEKLPDEIVAHPPPRVELISLTPAERQPTGDYTTTAAEIQVKVRIIAAPGDTPRLSVHANRDAAGSKRVRLQEEGQAPGERTTVVTLLPGDNQISLTAAGGRGSEGTPTIIRVRYAPADAPVRKTRELYVLSIGIAKYKDTDITPLRFAATDARSIARAFEAQQGLLFDRVKAVTLTDEEATGARVREEFSRMEQYVRDNGFNDDSEDLAVIFVSSHGFPEGEAFYFAPHDMSLKDMARTGVSWEEGVRRVRGLPATNVLLLLDNCFSGGAGYALQDTDKPYRRGFSPKNQAQRTLQRQNIVTFTSSSPEQESFEFEEIGHGVFTYALLSALEGRSIPSLQRHNVLSPNRRVILKPTEEFVFTEVGNLLASLKGEGWREKQTPSLFSLPGMNQRFPIAALK